ncbi:MAG TPA: transposase [Thermoanaerobaculia bacterium]|nr:transposase [Thermoanaerobaculia bacterium]
MAGGIYHVIARGNERRAIFLDPEDRRAYLDRLANCCERFGLGVFAYCLMDNHVHLAVQRGSVSVSRFVLALHSFYAQWFNRRHGRVGHLFQGRFKAFLVEEDRYLLALLRYIHLNPVRAKIVRHPREHRWSSDRCYRAGAGPDWLLVDRVLSMLAPRRAMAISRYRRLLDGAVDAEEYDESRAAARTVQGSDEFADRVLARSEPPVKRRAKWTVERVVEGVAEAYGLRVGDLKGRQRRGRCPQARAVAAYLGREEAGIPVARTALFLGRDESTLVRQALKLEDAMLRDARLECSVRELAARLRRADT